MRTWYISGNALKRYKYGSVDVEEMPWWLFVVDWWADYGCSFIPPIPFPKFFKITIHEDDGTTYESTPREYWGDLEQWYCGTVASPLTQWVFRHPKRKSYTVEIGYDKLREIFYESDKKWFDDFEKSTAEIEKEEELELEGEQKV